MPQRYTYRFTAGIPLTSFRDSIILERHLIEDRPYHSALKFADRDSRIVYREKSSSRI
jgi:hypothetical protein